MKKILLICFTLIILTGCEHEGTQIAENSQTSITTFENTQASVTTTTAITTTSETTAETTKNVPPQNAIVPTKNASENLKHGITLLNPVENDSEKILFTLPEKEYDPEMLKKYFYGVWYTDNLHSSPHTLTISETDECNNFSILSGDIAWLSENVISLHFINGGLVQIYWLDINEPDKMYMVVDVYGDESGYARIDYASRAAEYIKTAEAPVESGNFLSPIKIREINERYSITNSVLTQVEYITNTGQNYWLDTYYFNNPRYLISEENNRFSIKSSFGIFDVVDFTYDVYQKDGEWVNEVTWIDEKAIELAN